MLAEKYHWPMDSLQLSPLQSVPNMVAALAGGQVDATLLPANNAFKLRGDGTGEIIGWVGAETPWQLGALFTSSDHVTKDRALVERFVRAYQKGLADYASALLARDAAGKRTFGADAEALMPIFERWVRPKPTLEIVKLAANYAEPHGRLEVKSVRDQVAWFQRQGLVDRTVDPNQFLELGFVPGQQ
jgi:NitT/TauT family transport system substrate-binding protein